MVIVLSSRDKLLILVHEYASAHHFLIHSILDSQFLRRETFATQELSFKDQVETVNLPLSSTLLMQIQLTVQH